MSDHSHAPRRARFRIGVCAATLGAALAALAAPALAQQRPNLTAAYLRNVGATHLDRRFEVRRLPPRRTAFRPRLLEVRRGEPVAFRPFPMSDPQTGRPIDAAAELTLPNGKRVIAGPYFEGVNRLEARLNALGYSSREDPQEASRWVRPMVVSQAVLNRPLIDRQIAALPQPTSLRVLPQVTPEEWLKDVRTVPIDQVLPQRAPVRPSLSNSRILQRPIGDHRLDTTGVRTSAPPSSVITARVRDGAVIDRDSIDEINRRILQTGPSEGRLLSHNACKPFSDSRYANWDIGDPSDFEAHIHNSFTVRGQACEPARPDNYNAGQSNISISAVSDAGGSVLGYSVDLIKLQATLDGDEKTNTVGASVDVYIAGQSVFPLHPPRAAGGFNWTSGFSAGLGDPSFSGIVTILDIIDVDYTVGVKGDAGIRYGLDLSPTNVRAKLTPWVKAAAFGQAGIGLGTDVIGVNVGVGGDVTLVDATVDIGLDGGLVYENGAFAAKADLYGNFNVNMLAGSIYVFAGYYTPCVHLPPWCEHQARLNLFHFDGISYGSTLFDEHITKPIT